MDTLFKKSPIAVVGIVMILWGVRLRRRPSARTHFCCADTARANCRSGTDNAADQYSPRPQPILPFLLRAVCRTLKQSR